MHAIAGAPVVIPYFSKGSSPREVQGSALSALEFDVSENLEIRPVRGRRKETQILDNGQGCPLESLGKM